MKPFLLLTSALAIALLAGCDSADADGVRIRIRNASEINFESVTIEFPSEEAGYGAVGVGQATPYLEFERAYRYAAVEVLAQAAQVYQIQPVDFMEEDRLSPGRYTYVLDLEGGDLTLEVEEE